MKSRDNLPQFLNERHLFGVGAEVGVFRGGFSAYLLEHWHGRLLHSVDPWTEQVKAKLDVSNVAQIDHNINLMICKERLRGFGNRSNIMRMFSVEAAKKFGDTDLDFVYLDARHDYRSVDEDLRAWWPKVKRGGILSGHDYKNSFVRNNLVEVKRAVDNFCFEHGLGLPKTTTEDNLPSWYIIKP